MADAQPIEGEIIEQAQHAVAQLDPFSVKLAEFRERYDGIVYDLGDPAQEKQARSDRYAIGKVIADLDRTHADVKRPILEAARLLDGARREIKDGLIEAQTKVKAQIDEHAAREQARIQALQDQIEAIRALAEAPPGATAADVGVLLDAARAAIIGDDFEEFKADAALAKMEVTAALEASHAALVKSEAEAAELARLRAETEARERAEREERIRAEAAARAKAEAETKAKAEAERVEREKAEAEEAARLAVEAEKKRADEAEAEARAVADRAARAEARAAAQERDRIEREQALVAREAERQRKADEMRKAKRAHRKQIHTEARDSLVAAMPAGVAGTAADFATGIIEAIRDGKVAHVEIAY